MPETLEFTSEKKLLKAVLDGKRHVNYHKTVAHAHEMAVHIHGNHPSKLLTDYRPNEDAAVHNYRLNIFQPITKSCSKRCINVINGINNPRYYTFKFPEMLGALSSFPTLEGYDYPYFGSVKSWVFEIVVKQMLCDPNGIIAFEPIGIEEGNELYRPFGITYRSEQVLDFEIDEYYFIISDKKSEVTIGNTTSYEGNIYKMFTRTEVITFTQTGDKTKNRYDIESISHNIGEPPVITLGGEFVQDTWPFMYESYMSGILPFWNDAIREYSDKQANYVQHVYLERVEVQVKCDAQGCRFVPEKGYHGITVGDTCKECSRCKGSGYITGRTPYGLTVVKDEGVFKETNPLFPGVHYISKPTDIVKLLDDDIDKLIGRGYEAINMDILYSVGANQSGIAKQYDRSDLERYLMAISNNIFDNIIYYTYKYIAGWRYGYATNEWMELLPEITKPTNFDVLSTEILAAQLKDARAANLNPALIDQMELDLINRQFAGNEKLKLRHAAFIKLDPLSNIGEEEKFTRYSNGVISEVDYIISSNIKKFIAQAIEENIDFLEQGYTEQYAKMVSYAEAQRTDRQIARPDRPADADL